MKKLPTTSHRHITDAGIDDYASSTRPADADVKIRPSYRPDWKAEVERTFASIEGFVVTRPEFLYRPK